MGLTINLTLLKRKKRKNGDIPIYIRFTENRKSRYRSTGIFIQPKYWNNNKKEIRKSHRRSKHLNIELNQKIREWKQLKDELAQKDKLSLDNLLSTSSKENKDLNDLMTRAQMFHENLEGTERYHEWKKVGVLLNNLQTFLDGKIIPIKEVDAPFIERFQDFLLNDVGNNPNTVRRKLTSLKGLFLELLKQKEIKKDPFTAVDKVSRQPAKRTNCLKSKHKVLKASTWLKELSCGMCATTSCTVSIMPEYVLEIYVA